MDADPHLFAGRQAALVMRIVQEARAERLGQPMDEAKLNALERQVIDLYESMQDGVYASARLWDDGMIDPRDSRNVLGLVLSVCEDAERRTLRPNTFSVACF